MFVCVVGGSAADDTKKFLEERIGVIKKTLPVTALLLAAIGAGVYWLLAGLPSIDAIANYTQQEPSIRVLDRNGRLLYEDLPEIGGRQNIVSIDAIPSALIEATIATEDSRYYSHPGVDALSVARAIWGNVSGKQAVSGASTITQQVARNILLSEEERSERSLRRKIREAILAWQLTRHYDKDEILLLYLNHSYYGAQAYGVEAAAQTYFGKRVSELDTAECALLAGLPQAPGVYNPFSNPVAAEGRRRVVLNLMVEHGYLTEEERALAQAEPLVYSQTPYPLEAPHFVLSVLGNLDQVISVEEQIAHGGISVTTTLDIDWQRHAERAIHRQLDALRRSNGGLGHNVNSAALVALDPDTGEILSMVGSPDYYDDEHGGAINMAVSPRQPGSALKPLVYAAALDPKRRNAWTAATMLLDVRTSFVTHEGDAYLPENYDQKEHGPVLVRQALASSLNIPAVITLDHIGLPALFDLAPRLGITTLGDPDDYDLSLALGGGEVKLVELTAAYGAFANGGKRVHPVWILEVTGANGESLYTHPPPRQTRVMDERVAWLISDILSDNNARRLGFGENSALRLDRPAAVKTGTTTNFHDNWTIGYTPNLVVGVWTGNTDYEPMREVNGLTGAAPIWHQYLRAVLAQTPSVPFRKPVDMVSTEVCALSGLLPTDACPNRVEEWFIPGTEPTRTDDLFHVITLDENGDAVDIRSGVGARQTVIAVDLPPPTHAWARSQGILLLADFQRGAPTGQQAYGAGDGAQEADDLLIRTPANRSIYHISSSIPAENQKLHIAIAARPEYSDIELWMDGTLIGELSAPPYEVWIPLQVGEHRLWAEAETAPGMRITSESIVFEVKE